MKKMVAPVIFVIVCATTSVILAPCAANALCAAQAMAGKWINENPASRSFAQLHIDFPCYDTAGQSGPAAYVRAFGVCYPTPCDWGRVPATYTFVSTEGGWPQTTRVDTSYDIGMAQVNFVILMISNERLIVFSSQDFIEQSGRADLSRIDYFKPMKRWLTLSRGPDSPKQGDVMSFRVDVGDPEHLQRIHYKVGNAEGDLNSAPFIFQFDTCKAGGTYYTSLPVSVDAVYRDGEVVSFGTTYGLTIGADARENPGRTYAFYVAEDNDDDFRQRNVNRANAFIDEFDAYTLSQYHWAETWFFNTATAIDYANSVDLTIAIGHGSPQAYNTGNGWVTLSSTAFGNFAPCHRTGDLEYLALFSCSTLSIQNVGSKTFDYFWLNYDDSKLQDRPFTGLHMVLGFHTDISVDYSIFDDDGEDFFSSFAKSLDRGMAVKDAWLYAAYDELEMDDNKNRAAVLYLERHEYDRLTTVKDDVIYGHPDYGRTWVEYW